MVHDSKKKHNKEALSKQAAQEVMGKVASAMRTWVHGEPVSI